jgi:hypothetical protein
MQITIRNARLAFPNLFEAKSVNGGEPTFGASFIIPKDHPQVAEIEAAIVDAAKTKWGAKATDILKGLRMQDRLCLHDGDTKTQYDGFEGQLFVSANSKTRPLCADRDKSILSAADGVLYAGCFVYATVEIWAMDHSQFGKRVNAQVKTVQFFRDGDAFSGGRPGTVEDLVDLEEGADSDLA